MQREPRTATSLLHSDRGFTIIEVMFAATLFAVVASALTVASVGATRSNATSRDAAAATALIYDEIERLRALPKQPEPAELSAGTHADPLNPLTPLGRKGGTFERSWTVTQNSPRLGMSEVVVRVSWKDTTPRSLRASAYVCRSATCS